MQALIGCTRDSVDAPWRPVAVAIAQAHPPRYQFRTSSDFEDCDAAWLFAETLRTAVAAMPHALWSDLVARLAGSPASAYAARHDLVALDSYEVPDDTSLQDLHSWHVLAGRVDAFPGGPRVVTTQPGRAARLAGIQARTVMVGKVYAHLPDPPPAHPLDLIWLVREWITDDRHLWALIRLVRGRIDYRETPEPGPLIDHLEDLARRLTPQDRTALVLALEARVRAGRDPVAALEEEVWPCP